MSVLDRGIETLVQALLDQEFRAVDEFDAFVTFERPDDPLKIHVGPDGSFSVFNGDDELIAEGESADDLYRVLVSKTVISRSRPSESEPALYIEEQCAGANPTPHQTGRDFRRSQLTNPMLDVAPFKYEVVFKSTEPL